MAKLRQNRGLTYGIGVNDVDYAVNTRVGSKQVHCPFYQTWVNMLKRCYSEGWKKKYPTYEDCFVCEEWHSLKNFRAWMESQDWEGNQLDKDLLVKGNKEYSPETCAFVPRWLNNILLAPKSVDSKYPLGVSSSRKNFQAATGGDGKAKYVGTSKCPKEAHAMWQIAKAEAIESCVAQWTLHKSYRQDVADSLTARAAVLRFEFENRLETTDL